MKKLILAIVLALSAYAVTAHAEIGWTAKQCIQKFGHPVHSYHSVKTGDLVSLNFHVGAIQIQCFFHEGKVFQVKYQGGIANASCKGWLSKTVRDCGTKT